MGANKKLQNTRWVSYKIASLMAREANIKSRKQYWKWWDKTKPIGLSKFPDRVYKEWEGWLEFLGTENWFEIKADTFQYWSYTEAMKWAHKQKWSIREDFFIARRQKKTPEEMPQRPDIYYKNKGWISWPVFIGTTAQARIEAIKMNTSILAICIPPDTPGGYIVPVIKDTAAALKEYITHSGLKPIKLYVWEPDKKAILQNLLLQSGSLKDTTENLWLVQNTNQIIADLDQLLLWYRPTS